MPTPMSLEELAEANRSAEPLRLASVSFDIQSWAKLCNLRDSYPDHEVSCFGVTHPNNPMAVFDIWVPRQKVTRMAVDYDPGELHDDISEAMKFFNLPRENVSGIWVHTHPDMSANPSTDDWTAFARYFGKQLFGVMVILGRGGDSTCHLGVTAEISTDPSRKLWVRTPPINIGKIVVANPVDVKLQKDWDQVVTKVSLAKAYQGQTYGNWTPPEYSKYNNLGASKNSQDGRKDVVVGGSLIDWDEHDWDTQRSRTKATKI